MNLTYIPAVKKGANHFLQIGGEQILTTRAKKILDFAQPRITSKSDWKDLKEAVRLGEPLTITGGKIF